MLVLSKPIGTGIITTAGKQGSVAPDVMAGAVATMAALNRPRRPGDDAGGRQLGHRTFTGFGLLGPPERHGARQRRRRRNQPVLGAPPAGRFAKLLDAGIAPGGTHRNVSSVADTVTWGDGLTEQDKLLICDAQNVGRIADIGFRRRDSRDLVDALLEEGAQCAAVVGRITAGPAGTITCNS